MCSWAEALLWYLSPSRQHLHAQVGQGCDIVRGHPTRSVVPSQPGPERPSWSHLIPGSGERGMHGTNPTLPYRTVMALGAPRRFVASFLDLGLG